MAGSTSLGTAAVGSRPRLGSWFKDYYYVPGREPARQFDPAPTTNVGAIKAVITSPGRHLGQIPRIDPEGIGISYTISRFSVITTDHPRLLRKALPPSPQPAHTPLAMATKVYRASTTAPVNIAVVK